MANRIRTGDPHGFNKGCNSKFCEGFRVRQRPEEGQRTYRVKRCGNNNKNEDNSPKTLNDKKIIQFNINHLFAFANGPGDLDSIPGRVIPKTLKMVLDTTLLNTQHYKVRFKGKVEQSWEWSSALPYTLV